MRSPVVALVSVVLLATAVIAFKLGENRASESDDVAVPAGGGIDSSEFESARVPESADTADVIDGLLRQPTEFSFTHATFALAAASSATELEEYILASRGTGNPRRGVAIANIMLSAYVDLDPDAAFAFARLTPAEMRGTALFRVFADWSASDPDAAVAAVDWLRDPRERRAAEDGILQTASAEGPQRVSALAERLGRTDVNAAAPQLRARSNPRAAFDEARQLPQSERIMAVSDIGMRWATEDPEAAYEFARSQPVDSTRDYLMRAIFSAWGRSQPERVVEILDAGVAANDRYSIIHFGIAEMTRIDPARTFALVAAMQNGTARAEAMNPLMLVWSGEDPYAAVAALERLTTPDVPELATIVGPMFARAAPQPALDWAVSFDKGYGNTWRYVMGEIARQDINRALSLARQTPPEKLHEALILVVGSGAQANPDAAARALRELPADVRDTGTQHVVTEWIKLDAQAAQRWLLSQPPGSDRDRGLEVLTGDPNTPVDQLATLVNAIDAESRRVAAATSLLRYRLRDDRNAARNLLNQLNLPQESREQMQRMLDGTAVPGDRIFRLQ